MTGRPVLGPALVDRLAGSERAKLIVRTMLETIAGERTIDSAAQVLDCNGAYIHALRERLLEATIAAAEPRKPGPKPQATPAPDDGIVFARHETRDAEVALELERCRSELALVLGPRLGRGKKNRSRP
jgi:hypothetical protein